MAWLNADNDGVSQCQRFSILGIAAITVTEVSAVLEWLLAAVRPERYLKMY